MPLCHPGCHREWKANETHSSFQASLQGCKLSALTAASVSPVRPNTAIAVPTSFSLVLTLSEPLNNSLRAQRTERAAVVSCLDGQGGSLSKRRSRCALQAAPFGLPGWPHSLLRFLEGEEPMDGHTPLNAPLTFWPIEGVSQPERLSVQELFMAPSPRKPPQLRGSMSPAVLIQGPKLAYIGGPADRLIHGPTICLYSDKSETVLRFRRVTMTHG